MNKIFIGNDVILQSPDGQHKFGINASNAGITLEAYGSDNLDLVGNTVTVNGNALTTPEDGRLTLKMNGDVIDNSFTANTSTDTTVDLYNIMHVYDQSGASVTILPNSFYNLTGSVTAITLRESSSFINNYLNEYACIFTAGSTSVTISSYDSRTITMSTEGEDPSDIVAGDVYMLSVLAWKYGTNGSYNYKGVLKKFYAN